MTFGEMIEDLEHVLRSINSYKINEIPAEDDGNWMKTTDAAMEILIAHGLAKPSELPNPDPKKRGRRKTRPDFVGPKRPPWRPRTVEKAASLFAIAWVRDYTYWPKKVYKVLFATIIDC